MQPCMALSAVVRQLDIGTARGDGIQRSFHNLMRADVYQIERSTTGGFLHAEGAYGGRGCAVFMLKLA